MLQERQTAYSNMCCTADSAVLLYDTKVNMPTPVNMSSTVSKYKFLFLENCSVCAALSY